MPPPSGAPASRSQPLRLRVESSEPNREVLTAPDASGWSIELTYSSAEAMEAMAGGRHDFCEDDPVQATWTGSAGEELTFEWGLFGVDAFRVGDRTVLPDVGRTGQFVARSFSDQGLLVDDVELQLPMLRARTGCGQQTRTAFVFNSSGC